MKPEVWAVWPTVHLDETRKMIDVWHSFGYKVAVLVNPPFTNEDFIDANMVIVQDEWWGFPVAANVLCKCVPGNIVVVAGDDLYPDPNNTAEEIGSYFLKRFPNTCGVMQPTGDKFGWTHKCAVSPWLGRTFIEGAYEGNGPYREEYFHYFSDQELQEYATQNNMFIQREDLIQFHDHWQREEKPQRPEHLKKAGTLHSKDKKIFEERKLKGWPNGVK